MFSLAFFLTQLVYFYQILIFVSAILSWFPMRSEGILYDIRGAIDSLVAPYLSLFRRIIPPFGGLDFSPIVAILVLSLIQRLIIGIL